jgi:hypothetical protein
MKKVTSTHAVLGVAFAAAVLCVGAWSQSVQVVAEPVSVSSRQVTVTTETTTTAPAAQEVAVVKESPKSVHFHHEALTDTLGNVVDEIIVKTAPPAPREEVRRIETRPAEDAVWIPGYWQWDGDSTSYGWVPGTWRRAIPGMTWSPGRWNEVSTGYEWSPGFWSRESAAVLVDSAPRTVLVQEAPPALREEIRPVSPGDGMVWIAGNWSHDKGEYAWTSGRWERPVAEHMTWSPARWHHSSTGYGFAAGHWDYPVESRTYSVTTETRDNDRDHERHEKR